MFCLSKHLIKAMFHLSFTNIMQEKHTKLLQEAVNLLYYILIKMPQPTDLIPKPLAPETHWLDNQEVMEMLHVGPRTLQRWRSTGQLRFSKLKGKIWYLESDVNQMVKEGL